MGGPVMASPKWMTRRVLRLRRGTKGRAQNVIIRMCVVGIGSRELLPGAREVDRMGSVERGGGAHATPPGFLTLTGQRPGPREPRNDGGQSLDHRERYGEYGIKRKHPTQAATFLDLSLPRLAATDLATR